MTRFCISNIAWPPDADDEAVTLAAEAGFAGIELAPMKIFGPLESRTPDAAAAYRRKLDAMGLAIPALQAILFGVERCALFESGETRVRLAAHLEQVAILAGELGAGACVFGAPTLRDPGELAPETASAIAVDFFGPVAERFAAEGSALAFEANPAYYKCRFVTTTDEATNLVRAIDHPGLRLNLDTGTVLINGEGADAVERAAPVAGHFHVSEKDLLPPGQPGSDHDAIAAALGRGGYAGWRSVEMRANADWRTNIAQAAGFVRAHYDA